MSDRDPIETGGESRSLPVLPSDVGTPTPAGPAPSRLVVTLALAGLLSGLLIVTVYELTLPLIRANNARALRQAVLEVLPGAERMQRLVWTPESSLTAATGEETAGEAAVYGGYAVEETGETGEGESVLVGYAIPAAGAGFQDTIRLIYGFDPERRRIVGMQVLESRETPGLGDRIYKDEEFVAQFRDLAVEPRVELVKDGEAGENGIDALTGATISSRAVVDIINRGNAEWLERLPPAEQAPPLEEGTGVGAETPVGGPVPGGKE